MLEPLRLSSAEPTAVPRDADAAGVEPLLNVDAITRTFPGRRGRPPVRAVADVSLALGPGETLSLVGESGCGKSTLARMLLRLDAPTSGVVRFRGDDVHRLRGARLQAFRRGVQAVVQDPWSSLDPRRRVGWIIGEPLHVLGGLRGEALHAEVERLMTDVGLEPALAGSFPHEFSGGMRQRVAIARALAIRPAVIVLDEPVSALDVSVRAQIINLLNDIQETYGVSYLMISHDLATVAYLSDRIAVMYAGRIVEVGPARGLLDDPQHPYTRTLLRAARLEAVPGADLDVPGPAAATAVGCPYSARCERALPVCATTAPPWAAATHGGAVGCHLHEERTDHVVR